MIELPESVVADVNGSLMSGHPMIFVAVTPEQLPTVSFRGSVSVQAHDALGFWVRNPSESTLLRSIAERPTVVSTFANMAEQRFYQFTAQASIIEEEAMREKVFNDSPEFEQSRDPDKTGVAVLLTLTEVAGRGADGLFRMTADQ